MAKHPDSVALMVKLALFLSLVFLAVSVLITEEIAAAVGVSAFGVKTLILIGVFVSLPIALFSVAAVVGGIFYFFMLPFKIKNMQEKIEKLEEAEK